MPFATILPASLAIPCPSNRSLSSCRAFTCPDLFLSFSIASSFTATRERVSLATIRMGGGPRTFPGGVSKWQWKRMQAKKAKQLLKARLCRERQLYEMRKRAELKAAISELERPWEVVERAPVLFSASADEQVKALADRFQRPSGFDMWSERDGPRIFRSSDDLPTARFFPKGAVHSVKPYGVLAGELAESGEEAGKMMKYDDLIVRKEGGMERRSHGVMLLSGSSSVESEESVPREGLNSHAEENDRSYSSNSELVVATSRKVEDEMAGQFGRHSRNWGSRGLNSELVNARDFGRFGVRSQNFGSRSSDSEFPDSRSRIGRRTMGQNIGRRGRGGGHGRYRGSHQSYSEPEVNGSRVEIDEMVSNFSQLNDSDEIQGSYGSYSEHAAPGLKMHRQKMPGDFDRRNGHRGRGRNQASDRSHSEILVTSSRIKRDQFSDLGNCGVRGRNQRSYGSDSEVAAADSRKGRVGMARGFNFPRGGGRGQHRRLGERVSLRPTTELRLEEGGNGTREMRWNERRNINLKFNRGRRSL